MLNLFTQELKAATSIEEAARILDELVYREIDFGGEHPLAQKHMVGRIRGLSVHIYSDEHPPPHFHVVKLGEINASFAISDGRHLVGEIEAADLRRVRWWLNNGARPLLEAKWNELQIR